VRRRRRRRRRRGKAGIKATHKKANHNPNSNRCEDFHKFKERLQICREVTWYMDEEMW
jgi:hypothetical protein